MVAHQAVDEAYGGGNRIKWDRDSNTLTFTAEPEADGSQYVVAISARSAGPATSKVDAVATLTLPRTVTPEERAALRARMQREALQESRSMVAILMKQVAQGVGRGFADRPPARGTGLAGA